MGKSGRMQCIECCGNLQQYIGERFDSDALLNTILQGTLSVVAQQQIGIGRITAEAEQLTHTGV